MRRATCIIILLLAAMVIARAQTPVITDVTPISTYPGSKVVITGSGFNPTPANLDVWFDNVKGTITSSSDFAIEVTVPVGAKTGNVQVTNKTSGLSAKSDLKFGPFYSGESATIGNVASKFVAVPTVATGGSNEFADVCTCDFNLDGKADLAASKSGPTTIDMTILQNTSSGPGDP
jgi:hypothetical protein